MKKKNKITLDDGINGKKIKTKWSDNVGPVSNSYKPGRGKIKK